MTSRYSHLDTARMFVCGINMDVIGKYELENIRETKRERGREGERILRNIQGLKT